MFDAASSELQIPILFATMGFLEMKRLQGFKETGSSGFINSFPFDPAGMNSSDMAVKEIKNGRLAMVRSGMRETIRPQSLEGGDEDGEDGVASMNDETRAKNSADTDL